MAVKRVVCNLPPPTPSDYCIKINNGSLLWQRDLIHIHTTVGHRFKFTPTAVNLGQFVGVDFWSATDRL